jgi:hypothetical protein
MPSTATTATTATTAVAEFEYHDSAEYHYAQFRAGNTDPYEKCLSPTRIARISTSSLSPCTFKISCRTPPTPMLCIEASSRYR